jgi:hypothetical protein
MQSLPLTLTGVVKDWFTRLSPKSIDNFKELGYQFLAQFLATRKRKNNATCILTMRQGKEESMKEFILQFNKEKLEVDSPDEKIILNTLMREVKADGPLMAEIAKSSRSITLAQFMNKTKEYINQEELVGMLLKA